MRPTPTQPRFSKRAANALVHRRGGSSRAMLVALTLVGCGGSAEQRPAVHTPARTQAAAVDAAPHEPKEPAAPDRLQTLIDAVRALEVHPEQQVDPPAMSHALRALADALGPEARGEPAQISAAADRLETLPAASPSSAVAAKSALLPALRFIQKMQPPSSDRYDYNKSLVTLSQLVDNLQESMTPSSMRLTTGAAIRAATDALALAHEQQAPFGVTVQDADESQLSCADRLQQTQEHVLRLGRATWTEARLASADALFSFADLVAAQKNKDHTQREAVELRKQADRLRRADALSFLTGGWVKTALMAALRALDLEHAPTDPSKNSELLARWTQSARRAASGLEEQRPLHFQRAEAADAFRATVDAFQFAADTDQLCP